MFDAPYEWMPLSLLVVLIGFTGVVVLIVGVMLFVGRSRKDRSHGQVLKRKTPSLADARRVPEALHRHPLVRKGCAVRRCNRGL